MIEAVSSPDHLRAELGLSSEVGRGSVFRVALPRAEMAAIVQFSVPPAPAESPRPGLILVIDDEIAIQEAMRSLLSEWGHQVVCAGSYDEMIGRIADHPARPDLIICDYRLRGAEDGGTVISQLQTLYNEDIPALLVTGDTAPARIREAASSGFLLLHKPVTNQTLRAAIAAALSLPVAAET